MIRRRDGRPVRDERFRRRQTVVSRRRENRILKLVKPFLGALVAVGLPLLGGTWILTSPQLQVSEVEITGFEKVERSWLTDTLESVRGVHILWLSLEDIEAQLSRHPWIESVEARKELPNRLVISVHEKTAFALLRQGDQVFFVDGDGAVIDEYDPALGSSDLVLLSSPDNSSRYLADALEIASRLEQLQPYWASQLSEIEVLNEQDYRLFTGALPFPILVSLETMEAGIPAMREYLPEITRRYRVVRGVDIRFSNQIVIQPAAIGRRREG